MVKCFENVIRFPPKIKVLKEGGREVGYGERQRVSENILYVFSFNNLGNVKNSV